MDSSEKVREDRLRRMAERQGFRLIKSRRRDPLAVDFGKYELAPSLKGVGHADVAGRLLTIDEVEQRLTRSDTSIRENQEASS